MRVDVPRQFTLGGLDLGAVKRVADRAAGAARRLDEAQQPPRAVNRDVPRFGLRRTRRRPSGARRRPFLRAARRKLARFGQRRLAIRIERRGISRIAIDHP